MIPEVEFYSVSIFWKNMLPSPLPIAKYQSAFPSIYLKIHKSILLELNPVDKQTVQVVKFIFLFF